MALCFSHHLVIIIMLKQYIYHCNQIKTSKGNYFGNYFVNCTTILRISISRTRKCHSAIEYDVYMYIIITTYIRNICNAY